MAARWLPMALLIVMLLLPALFKAVVEIFFRKKSTACFVKLKNGLTDEISPVPLRVIFSIRVRLNLNRMMTFWGEQLRDPKWRARVEYSGIEHVLEYVDSGRSVLLTSVHYGSPREASTILRSRGLHVSALASGNLSPLEQKAVDVRDRLWGLNEVPVVINPLEMWKARDFLNEPGNMLIMLVDRKNNRRDMSGTFLGGQIQVAKGVVTLAEITNAVVVPVACTSIGLLSWRLWFGEGMEVIDDAGRLKHDDFCQQILGQLSSEMRQSPNQLHPTLIGSMMENKNNK